MSGIHALTLSGSVRYDEFSDFGDTTNSKVGLSYEPVDWLTLHGNWSTSFNAPSPVDQLGSLRNFVSYFPFNPFVRPGETPAVTGAVALQGSNPDLQPQEAETYAIGFDVDPPFLEGLSAGANYYNVEFNNLLGIPTPNPSIFTDFPGNVITNVNGLSDAELLAFAELAPNGHSIIDPIIANNTPIYEAIIFVTGNYGSLNTDGVDFHADYVLPTSFGSLDASLAGNYVLSRTTKLGAGAPEVDVLENNTSRLQLQASLGATFGAFRTQATLNHSSGYDVIRSSGLPQDEVDAFNTVNLYFSYDVPTSSLESLRFSLNVNNAFDEEPPEYRNSGDNGYANGFTLGRLIMIGASARF